MENHEFVKAIPNINSSFWNKKIFRYFTIKSFCFAVVTMIIGLIVGIILLVYHQNAAGGIIIILFAFFALFFAWNFGFYLNVTLDFFKYLFLKKTQKLGELKTQENFVKKNKKWYGFYEIQSKSLINMDEYKIMNLVNRFTDYFANEVGWSWLKVNFSFSSLKDQLKFLAIDKLNEWLQNKNIDNLADDIVAMNIYSQVQFTQEVILNTAKNKDATYLLVLSGTDFEAIKTTWEVLNKNMNPIDFYLKPLNDERMQEVLDNYFLVGSEIRVDLKQITAKMKLYNHPQNFAELYSDLVNENKTEKVVGEQTKYLSFFKISEFPIYVMPCFLSDIFNQLEDVEVALHTYEITEKKESKIYHRELETQRDYVNQSIKEAERKKSEQNLEALDEMLNDALSSSSRLQKYELIIRLSKETKQELKSARKQIHKLLKSWKFGFNNSIFNQMDLLKSFNRHLNFATELKKFNANMLTNDRFGFSYPFTFGKVKNDNDFLWGYDLDNGQPFFKNWHKIGENNHAIFIGPTGVRKTAAVKQKTLNNVSSQKVRTIFIDPTGKLASDLSEHKDFIDLKPQIISMNDMNATLNPWELVFLFENDQEHNFEQRHQVDFMLNFFKTQFSDFNNDIEVFLREAITMFIRQRKNYASKDYMDMFFQLVTKMFSQIEVYKKCDPLLRQRIFSTIKDLTLKYGTTKYWAQPSSLEIKDDSDVVLITLDPASSGFSQTEKIKVLMLLQWLKYYIYSNKDAQGNSKKYIEVVIDEFSTFIKNNDVQVVKTISELFAMIRKYNASITLILQNISTFATQLESNTYLSEIWGNTRYLHLFAMQESEIGHLKKLIGDNLDLNEKERVKLANLDKIEHLLITDNKKYWLHTLTLASPFYLKQHPSFESGIKSDLNLIKEFVTEINAQNLTSNETN